MKTNHRSDYLFLLTCIWMVIIVWCDVADDGYKELCDIKKSYQCKCPSIQIKDDFTMECADRGLTNTSQYIQFIDQIRDVNFRNNLIKSIPQNTFVKARNVSSMDLSFNNIDYIAHSAFQSLSNLRKLILSHNSIWNLANTFDGLNNLEILDLSYNRIQSWDSSLFLPCLRLRELNMRDNAIGAMGLGSDGFQRLPRLEKLNLENTGLCELSVDIFANNYQLKYLYLSGNSFTRVPNIALQRAKMLQFLDMSATKLQSIQYEDFAELTQLNELHLERINTLEKIETNAFQDLHKLRSFHCNYNYNLKEINAKAFTDNMTGEPINVKNLFLRSNQLESLNSETLMWRGVHRVDFEGNPWHCDCNLRWMAEYKMSGLSMETKCSKPHRIAEQPIKSLSASDFICASFFNSDTFLISVLIFMIMATIAVIAIAFLFMRNLWLSRCYNAFGKDRTHYMRVVANKERVDLEWDHSAEP